MIYYWAQRRSGDGREEDCEGLSEMAKNRCDPTEMSKHIGPEWTAKQFYVPHLGLGMKSACETFITRNCRWNGILFESPVNPQRSLCRFGAIPYQDWV